MVEQTLNLHQANAMSLGRRPFALWSIAAAHVAFAAICSPLGVRSGDLPDSLVVVASGAVWVYPLILFPLWAGLGCRDVLPRFAPGLLLCLAFVAAALMRGRFRDSHEPLFIPFVFVMASFSLMTLCFWWIQRFWKWRMGISNTSPMRSKSRAYRPQFRLRHLLEGITLACCVLALYRFHFPDGFPVEVVSDWWQQVARLAATMPFAVLFFLPAVSFPWLVLAVRHIDKNTFFLAVAVVSCCVAYDGALTWLLGGLCPYTAQEVLWIQLGASAAGMLSAIVLRWCGYRIFRVEAGPECPA